MLKLLIFYYFCLFLDLGIQKMAVISGDLLLCGLREIRWWIKFWCGLGESEKERCLVGSKEEYLFY